MAAFPPDHPSQPALREMIERQTAQLTRIVDDILDMARITKGVIAIERVPVDLGAHRWRPPSRRPARSSTSGGID